MKKQILLLNESYMPINVTTFKKATKMLCQHKVEILETYNNEYYENGIPKNPSVIKLKHSVLMGKTRRIYKDFSRRNILERDDYKCQYCHKTLSSKTMHWDHVVPRDRGGATNFTNIVACCLKCNQKKENKTLDESGFKLKSKPEAPFEHTSVYIVIMKRINRIVGKKMHDSWKKYIYWRK